MHRPSIHFPHFFSHLFKLQLYLNLKLPPKLVCPEPLNVTKEKYKKTKAYCLVSLLFHENLPEVDWYAFQQSFDIFLIHSHSHFSWPFHVSLFKLIVGSWPSFLINWEKRINPKRNSAESQNLPTYTLPKNILPYSLFILWYVYVSSKGQNFSCVLELILCSLPMDLLQQLPLPCFLMCA